MGSAARHAPPDDLFVSDLTAPHWRVLSGGKILIESKEEIARRLGRSTNDGDAVVMAFEDAPAEDPVALLARAFDNESSGRFRGSAMLDEIRRSMRAGRRY